MAKYSERKRYRSPADWSDWTTLTQTVGSQLNGFDVATVPPLSSEGGRRRQWFTSDERNLPPEGVTGPEESSGSGSAPPRRTRRSRVSAP